MCGIAGIVSNNPTEISYERLKSMTDSILHRGPDGEGLWIDEKGMVALGHRRLSIIDLSEGGKQPMHYLDRYTITFNGEIYNYIEIKKELEAKHYRFNSQTDTEVLMALYDLKKEACLADIDGMFAFAIYDKKEKTLFCARDRFGEKPFHYHYVPGKLFAFGSEIKELWAAGIPRIPSDKFLYNYLRFGLLSNPKDSSETFFTNIKKLEHAHYLVVDVEQVQVRFQKYWSINTQSEKRNISLNEATERFRELFYESVQRRLRSDVPVGSSLSGGLDSSLVVCAIDGLNLNKLIHQKTFSARFPGYEKDESYYQQLVIDKTNADAYFTYPDSNVLLGQIDKVFYHQDEPFGSSSILAQYEVFKLAKDNNVTVLLDGQGADEILAGYHFYYQYYFLELEKFPDMLKIQWDAYVKLHGNNAINGIYRKDLKYHLRKIAPFAFNTIKNLKKAFHYDAGPFTKDFYHQMRKDEFSFESNFKTLNEALANSTMGGGLQDLLRYADRNSMAHSREVRLPFLYHELVEFMFSLPATFKINNGWTKFIMREAFNQVLPSEISWRVDKIGYEPPQHKWMKLPEVKEIIRSQYDVLAQNGILDKSKIEKTMDGHYNTPYLSYNWNLWMGGKLMSK